VVGAVDLPVNVLVLPGMPTVSELAEAGVSRISVGGGFAFAALGAAAAAGRELLAEGTYDFWETAAGGAKAAREAFKR
jgi:2-methylisocitrate lyase-like PEP mutase family enzyme